MVVDAAFESNSNVSDFTGRPRSTSVSDELGRLRAMLVGACPREAIVMFVFDGQLRVQIDVRSLEHLVAVEAVLANAGGGLFHSMSRGAVPGHPFLRRLTALVDR